ncbi:MAG: hypothetical protein KC492_29250 [Myxococcales bacterium]|nr:hypothetical protein [Myxococcales bacterium]
MRTPRHLLSLVALSIALLGCETPGVGDPCNPEQVPSGGFNPTESYLETSSVQCRTRVCMVFEFSGDPSRSLQDCMTNPLPTDPPGCAGLPTDSQINERVYCTCRCKPPEGSNTIGCECPEGFTCQEDLLALGGEGIKGGYCVRSTTVTP